MSKQIEDNNDLVRLERCNQDQPRVSCVEERYFLEKLKRVAGDLIPLFIASLAIHPSVYQVKVIKYMN